MVFHYPGSGLMKKSIAMGFMTLFLVDGFNG
jgi:hypothetical protein